METPSALLGMAKNIDEAKATQPPIMSPNHTFFSARFTCCENNESEELEGKQALKP